MPNLNKVKCLKDITAVSYSIVTVLYLELLITRQNGNTCKAWKDFRRAQYVV